MFISHHAYAAQICDVLDAAYKRGSHRDLKPANILLTKQGITEAGKTERQQMPFRSTSWPARLANSIIIDSMRSLLFLLARPAVYAQSGPAMAPRAPIGT